jgi:hypothetical protein
MNLTIAIPDDVAARLGSEAELERRALEALSIEEFRAGRLTKADLQQVLAFQSCGDVDDFLQRHGVAVRPEAPADLDLVSSFRSFAEKHTLGGISIKALINEGRR